MAGSDGTGREQATANASGASARSESTLKDEADLRCACPLTAVYPWTPFIGSDSVDPRPGDLHFGKITNLTNRKRALASRALVGPCPSLPVIPPTLPSPKRHVAGLAHHFCIACERVHLTRAPEAIWFRCRAVGDEHVGLCGFHSLFARPSAYARLIRALST